MESYLKSKGYEIDKKAFDLISECDNWYSNRRIDEFHNRKTVQGAGYELNRMNMAKRCCSDDANLCEIISVVTEKDSNAQPFIDNLLRNNKFDTQYRIQLEKVSAHGTACAYIYLESATYLQDNEGKTNVENGTVCINYVDADCYIPLSVIKGEVTEAAFSSTNKVKGKSRTTLVIFAKDENGAYTAETVIFDETGKKIDDLYREIQLGDVKPFAVMNNAEVNNLDHMDGYGLPKVYNSIPLFKAIDLCYNVLFSDLDKAEKLILVNELLCEFGKDGKPKLTPEQQRIFVLLGEKIPGEKELYQEYNPEIRIEEITKSFELVLSLLSMSFGYGTKKYTFENGQIKTATEYAGERQDSMQELNKQRKQAEQYITDIIHAAMWFENQFNKTNYDIDEALSIQFDDSYVEDKVSKLEAMRADAISFPEVPILKKWYLMQKYNISESDAIKYIDEGQYEEIDETED